MSPQKSMASITADGGVTIQLYDINTAAPPARHNRTCPNGAN